MFNISIIAGLRARFFVSELHEGPNLRVTVITIFCRDPWSNGGMNIRRLMTGFAALAMTVSTGVYADDIYKWTDAEGNVYYEDRPSGEPTEERLQFSYNRTNRAAVQSRVQTRRDSANTRRAAKADAEGEKRTAAENRAAAEERLAKCQDYRAKLKTMLESRRVYRENAAGERNYLDDAARAEARSKAEGLIKDTCGE